MAYKPNLRHKLLWELVDHLSRLNSCAKELRIASQSFIVMQGWEIKQLQQVRGTCDLSGFFCLYSNYGRVPSSHTWLYFRIINLVSFYPSILKTKTGPVSAFAVWENVGCSVSAFGSETSQQGLFVFCISDYNNACQIALCFMPMHAATSEGKVPFYRGPSDKSWRPKECCGWFSVLRVGAVIARYHL